MKGDHLFTKHDLSEYLGSLKAEIALKVQKMDKDYPLNVSEADLCEHLVSEHRLYCPVLLREDVYAHEPKEVDVDVSQEPWRFILDRSRPVYIRGTSITIVVPFDGEEHLFDYRPSTRSTRVPQGKIVDKELHLTYTTTDHNAESLKQALESDLQSIETYLQWVRHDIQPYNDMLPHIVEKALRQRKEKLLADAGLAASLGIPIRRRSQASLTFSPPELRRKPNIPRPQVTAGPYQAEPVLPEDDYEYILKVVENMVLVMERSPRAFAKMDEEALRDHFLVQLNGHYEGLATGETFNYGGKTDILIRYEGKNVFIAECMFWRGPKSLLDKLDQLLDYTSWRDTKTAVLVFNRRRSLSDVLRKVSDKVPEHKCYKRTVRRPEETHFRYVFHQPHDKNREVIVTVMVFDVPSNQHDNRDNAGPEGSGHIS